MARIISFSSVRYGRPAGGFLQRENRLKAGLDSGHGSVVPKMLEPRFCNVGTIVLGLSNQFGGASIWCPSGIWGMK